MALTPKQMEFCRVYIETSNATEAYTAAYNTENMAYATVKNEGYKLLKNHDIAATIQQLQSPKMMKAAITRDDLIAELEEARQAALCAETPQAGAATSATMGKAKLLGLDKIIIDHQSSDGSMTPQAPLYKIADE